MILLVLGINCIEFDAIIINLYHHNLTLKEHALIFRDGSVIQLWHHSDAGSSDVWLNSHITEMPPALHY